MQKAHWILKSPQVLAVPILMTKVIQNICYLYELSNFHVSILIGILGIITLTLGLCKSKKLLSTTLIITGIFFLIYASSIILIVRCRIPGIYLFTTLIITLIIGGYLYLQRTKGK